MIQEVYQLVRLVTNGYYSHTYYWYAHHGLSTVKMAMGTPLVGLGGNTWNLRVDDLAISAF